MRKTGLILLGILVLILVALLVIPNLRFRSKNSEDSEFSEGSSSQLSEIARYITGPSDDGLCDACGSPATMRKRGYEVCSDCYKKALNYYNSTQ